MFNWQIPDLGAFILIFVIWEAFWKGVGLWKSAKKGDTVWFIAIFVINTFGILPLVYLWRTKQLEPALRDIQNFFKSLFSRFHKK